MNTLTEDIPCEKYDHINSEFALNGNIYRWVSVPGDEGYECGLLNMKTLKEDIPCKKYDFIGSEFALNGNTYRRVSVPGDDEYEYGFLNTKTWKEDIPVATYVKIEPKENDVYQCTKPDGTLDSYRLIKK